MAQVYVVEGLEGIEEIFKERPAAEAFVNQRVKQFSDKLLDFEDEVKAVEQRRDKNKADYETAAALEIKVAVY